MSSRASTDTWTSGKGPPRTLQVIDAAQHAVDYTQFLYAAKRVESAELCAKGSCRSVLREALDLMRKNNVIAMLKSDGGNDIN